MICLHDSSEIIARTHNFFSCGLAIERNSHRWSPFTSMGHHLPAVGAKIRRIIGSDPSIQIPHLQKSVAVQWPNREIPGPKTPRTDTILPEHLLTHTLLISVYSHYCIWSFCHHFPCKNDVLITSTQVYSESHFQTPKTCQSLTQTFYLLLAAVLSIYDIIRIY